MTKNGDIGPKIIRDLQEAMMIDAEWSVREDRRFTWWGHDLAQRVWAEPVRQDTGFSVVCVRAETDLLCGVCDSQRTAEILQSLNCHAAMSGFVWNRERGTVKLSCSAYCHSENAGWLTQLLSAAVAMQCADAHIKAGLLPQFLGSQVDRSSHPRNGLRPEPDDMLHVIEEMFAPEGRGPSAFGPEDFSEACGALAPYALAHADESGLTAEFAFSGSAPAVGISNGIARETALLEVTSDCRHPQLGSGVLLLLKLPLDCDPNHGASVAQQLNAAEASQWTRCHQFGGWCVDPKLHAPTFACFIPSALRRRGLLASLATQMLGRTIWAHEVLCGGGNPVAKK
ncbi:MAG: hypothetical protein ACE141_09740 [Bryobacteraceae bacterium]